MSSLIFTPHDITLISEDGKSFLFWKKVLIKYSDYFEAKFSSGMSDSKDGICRLEVSGDILYIVLCVLSRSSTTKNGDYLLPFIFDEGRYSNLPQLYRFADMYIFSKIAKMIQFIYESMSYCKALLDFVRNDCPDLLTNEELAKKLLHELNLHDQKNLRQEDIDEDVWMIFFNLAHCSAQMAYNILITDIIDDKMKEKIMLKMESYRRENVYKFFRGKGYKNGWYKRSKRIYNNYIIFYSMHKEYYHMTLYEVYMMEDNKNLFLDDNGDYDPTYDTSVYGNKN